MDPLLRQHFFRQPETPTEPMEFLTRSWSSSSLQLSNTLSLPQPKPITGAGESIPEDIAGEGTTISSNPFSFASSETCQLVMERIMSQSQEVSPLTSGRLSYSNGSLTDSPPVSPSDIIDDLKYCRLNSNQVMINNHHHYQQQQQRFGAPTGAGGGKTVGRWFKDRREKKKEEMRAHNAQLHAAISVAGVAAAIAAIAAAKAASSASRKDEQMAKTDMAVCSAATLVAAQCVEAAEGLGVEREHLASVISSAVNVHSAGDIMGLTATAATALRGAATLKARALREVWNVAAVIPAASDKRRGGVGGNLSDGLNNPSQENFLGMCSREMLARGCELLKRTRNGVTTIHFSVYKIQ
ncbi:VAN3-binding protein-like [Impatiens glandulifera]|uniref:VAN3-binding protein-like n=1 Tax=Impatiens glandulifera TaxID=253017 RepID=UPI001FB14CAA|nr:VAN3-binding protein-like [Impatiens glandulifera]